MKAKYVFYGLIGGLVVCSGIGVAGIVLGNSWLQKQSKSLVSLKVHSQALDDQQLALAQAKQDIVKYTPLNTIAQTIVPEDKDQALTVREITDLAANTTIKIGSITFPASNLGQPKTSAGGNTSTVSPTFSKSQLTVVPGLSGVYQMPITVQSDSNNPITFIQLISFLQALETNRHTAQVGQLTITPSDASGQHLSFTLIINVFIKP